MNKIICNSVDFVFVKEVNLITPCEVVLKEGCIWKMLEVRQRPIYKSDITRTSSGVLKEESVSAVTRYDADSLLKMYGAFPLILRLRMNEETFYVGSQYYPVSIEVSDDKIYDTYTFKSKSPL